MPDLDQFLRLGLNVRFSCSSRGRFIRRAMRPTRFRRARYDRYLLCLNPCFSEVIRIMSCRTVNDMTHSRMQALIAGIHLHVHYIPAFELDIADLPFLARAVAAEYKSALTGTNHYIHFGTHGASFNTRISVLTKLYHNSPFLLP